MGRPTQPNPRSSSRSNQHKEEEEAPPGVVEKMATNITAEEWREWGRLVDQLNVQALVEEQDTRVVNATDTMIDALGLFAAHDVLSAPVYDATCNGFVGLIDMLDLVAFLCRFSGSLGGTKRLEREQLNLDSLKNQLASLNEDQRAQI